ncbi:type 2 isopentenyl-diphosphate Delta-isomerase [Leucobacter sp. OLJS4]|uniref:type 2 isopentenyl-diphosphate Delta-isomerase n=1 Tax=unclassified Leucobacter TaxID=2621730 RepID=UPI000C18EF7F|nr:MULTISPECIES: type 2 isopentenyl-diphosphate Delta-isomerase [unclassified Leucobacter]PII83806.1 type 2 isopentenyl-diphosphate Delta-isomerase [Leucobacter sp. OLCALW19]PII89339.1 type 2 isopentenyl-diphosphate Delta-isomerase [Leucobacter sp. OLTLW20]PII90664.1 type 2 isopentenyl-diphosphate Delta-isomerase [Leucobacter sp. OLAS13]PII96675.1 type 2 isopentenyl-diphosphate Delta-isomerase [Leucobacter sp. OLCS4]PII99621.1 type 2 isopentenyl-diphosphate Delta-isomerase [Leucobacter sp. OLD
MHSDHREVPGTRAARKDEHVDLALEQRGAAARNEFDELDFVHQALGGVDADRIDLGVTIPFGAGARHDAGEWHWRTPFYVNGMTGGTERTTRINRELAIAARETGMPMACGSVSVALDDPDAARGFAVIRAENPDGFVMANVGVGRPATDAPRAVELLGADALQVHVNAVQETVMPEGSRDFSSWLSSVEQLAAASPVPVIVKEVGFGLSRATLRRLADIGVRLADVSGRGGTDFLRIENARREAGEYAMLTGFGQSALASLLDAPASAPTLLASGGVRTPYDVVKALAAGARAVGVAGAFLEAIGPDGTGGGAERLIALVEDWKTRTRAVYALLGATTRDELLATDLVLRGRLREFCTDRGVDLRGLASRSEAPRA